MRLDDIDQKPKVIIGEENADINSLIAGTFGLKGYEVYKAFSAEECISKVTELDGKAGTLLIDGKIATDRGAMVISKAKRINPDIRVFVLADNENDKSTLLDYGADIFTTKPISPETIADKVTISLAKKSFYVFDNDI